VSATGGGPGVRGGSAEGEPLRSGRCQPRHGGCSIRHARFLPGQMKDDEAARHGISGGAERNSAGAGNRLRSRPGSWYPARPARSAVAPRAPADAWTMASPTRPRVRRRTVSPRTTPERPGPAGHRRNPVRCLPPDRRHLTDTSRRPGSARSVSAVADRVGPAGCRAPGGPHGSTGPPPPGGALDPHPRPAVPGGRAARLSRSCRSSHPWDAEAPPGRDSTSSLASRASRSSPPTRSADRFELPASGDRQVQASSGLQECERLRSVLASSRTRCSRLSVLRRRGRV